jgi:hypothetical protein
LYCVVTSQRSDEVRIIDIEWEKLKTDDSRQPQEILTFWKVIDGDGNEIFNKKDVRIMVRRVYIM